MGQNFNTERWVDEGYEIQAAMENHETGLEDLFE